MRNNRGRDVISYRTLADLGSTGGSGGGGVPPSPIPSNAYITESGSPYVTEDGASFYVTEA